jgi:tetratricopeptide (TPR) repeat protein
MADTVGLEALVKDIEGRVARLREVAQELEKLDTTEFPAEVEALRALLKNPGQVEEAERRLGELKSLIQREGQRRRARRLLDEGVSLGNRGAALLAEGSHGEAQASLGQSLERLAQAETALGDGDPRLLESIAANRRALSTNLLRSRLGEALARSQQGVAEFDGQAFDQAEAIFQEVRSAVDSIAQEAAAQELQEVADEAARHVQELDQNIEGCRIGRDSLQVEELVQQANARWEESEQAVGQRDLLQARDTLAEAARGLESAFGIANRRSFQDVLATINQLRRRVQGRLDEIYDALSRGVTVAPLPPMPVTPVRPKPPVVRAGESIPAPAMSGQQAARWDQVYELQQLLGQGGYADVYLARRLADGVQVALKVPRGLLAGERTLSDELLRDFQREADNWQRLNHPHIVQLYEHGGVPFPWLAMELMSGGSLTSRLGKLPVRQALDIFIKVCRALEYAHSGGFVHRDLKPENILFNADGAPKVSDWGLARHALFQSLGQGYSGSLPYSAPEQVEPERFGPYEHPGDVFQLGIVIYETLTGRHPFLLPGEELSLLSPLVVPRRIADAAFDVAPPTSARAGLPSALDAIVLQALRRPPRERHREMWMLREALEPAAGGLEGV